MILVSHTCAASWYCTPAFSLAISHGQLSSSCFSMTAARGSATNGSPGPMFRRARRPLTRCLKSQRPSILSLQSHQKEVLHIVITFRMLPPLLPVSQLHSRHFHGSLHLEVTQVPIQRPRIPGLSWPLLLSACPRLRPHAVCPRAMLAGSPERTCERRARRSRVRDGLRARRGACRKDEQREGRENGRDTAAQILR